MQSDHVCQIIGCRINPPTLPVNDIGLVLIQPTRMKTVPEVSVTMNKCEIFPIDLVLEFAPCWSWGVNDRLVFYKLRLYLDSRSPKNSTKATNFFSIVRIYSSMEPVLGKLPMLFPSCG